MKATRFEFERRFWIIAAIYFIGFSLSRFDQKPFLSVLRHFLAPSFRPGTEGSIWFSHVVLLRGTALVVFAASIRTWAAAYLRSDVVHDPRQHSEALVADGPFRHTRNPLYFASLPMATGIGLLASTSGFFFLVLGNWFFVYRLIFREEAALRQTQGGSYETYLQTVPRFWPSFKARVPAANTRPRWAQAFVGETFIWVFALAELCLAITLNASVGIGFFVAGFAAHFITNRALFRKIRNR